MAFDQPTRNRLQRFVSNARDALTVEFTRQLQNVYGLDPKDGSVTPLENLRHLDDAGRETARLLRDTLEHYMAGSPSGDRREALDRIVREQAFTVLNRLAALRMAEARGILTESVSKGYESKGFQLYFMLVGTGHGETGDAYRSYLFSLFDEFALDLNVLFDRFSPQGRLFPREASLLQLLGLMNDQEVAPLWGEDETIGWIYQYFNSKEERKKMRDASPAPRNSRELAVRNQFFTPRYVVEFLTDNTLGRIWYEMTRGETRLKDECRYLVRRPNEVFLEPDKSPPEVEETTEQNLSQEELLKHPVYIPHRLLKDPRTIRVLDPACGSMHFGLYAYDLLEVIYAEAWELEATRGADTFSREPGLLPLRETYADEEAFLRNVPRLIIEHNLHGIDIDPRAVQIAGLSLWLRAQRAWAARGVKPGERPQIRRSNIVCAEPMPGEETLLKEFVAKNLAATPELRLLGQLVRHIFDAMKLAGEAGSLLKIEAKIADAVVEAKQKWLEAPTPKQDSLFAEMVRPEQQRLGYEVAGITDEAFWERAEKLIYEALQSYAEKSENGGGYQRRLFSDDAARGFAFIDLCRKRYDVVVMNPPFGAASNDWKPFFEKLYPRAKIDLYAGFVERGIGLLNLGGAVGAITARTGFFMTSLQKWREETILTQAAPTVFADLGNGVLDSAMVETAAYCLSPFTIGNTIFFRMFFEEDKPKSLARSVQALTLASPSPQTFHVNTRSFAALPGSPFSYWVGEGIRKLFAASAPLESHDLELVRGGTTMDDFRFLRTWWETDAISAARNRVSTLHGKRWVPFAKGGEFSRYYCDWELTVDWKDDGAGLKEAISEYRGSHGWGYQWTAAINGHTFYFLPGITFPRRTTSGINVRVLPKGCIFADQSPTIIAKKKVLWTLLGLMNSPAFMGLVALQLGAADAAARSYQVGIINTTPVPPLETNEAGKLAELASKCIDLKRQLYRTDERSHLFTLPELVTPRLYALADALATWRKRAAKINSRLFEHQNEIDDHAFGIYGMAEQDRRALEESISVATPSSATWEESPPHEDDVLEDSDAASATTSALAGNLVSYLIGSAFGCWDIRYATGERATPELPDPFAPLPVCPPGMLQNKQGLPAVPEDMPESYPLRISWQGILVDDPGHTENIEGRAREALQVIWLERADAIEQEACEILGVRSLREYFRKPNLFFADHLSRYSKSRRQAPIYWALATPSGSYTLWLYYHRLDAQTLYKCVVDFVEPKLRQTHDALGQFRAKANRARDEERELERLQDFALELQAFRDELLRLAQLPWRPDLNDGVQITAAPLWKLFRLPKWQKTLKETWQKLEKGDYDWAHLAMTIWPERVVPKCVKDRSLAIAHGLEDLFWVEDTDGWRKLRRPEQEIEEQKKRQRSDARTRVKLLLTKLASSEEGNQHADEVRRRLAGGEWDDREVALLLYPHRVADACWADPTIAQRLDLQLPARRSEVARQQFTKKLIKSGCPDLASAFESALCDITEPFRALWDGMERGDHDDFEVAIAFWPDRVVDKCSEDVFMAERHGIRQFLWCQHPSDEWRRREVPEVEVANEVARRRGAARHEEVSA